MNQSDPKAYWKANLKLVAILLTLWATVSFGCSIIFRSWLDANFPSVGHAPFGFWMAQQGSIVVFVILMFTYAALMNKLDQKFGFGDDSSSNNDQQGAP